MSRNLRLGASSIAFSKPLYIESAASIVSQKEADRQLLEIFLTWSAKIPCLAVTPGNPRKVRCRKKLPHLP